MDKTLLADLIGFNGIETAFTDAWGNAAEVAEKDQLRLLQALGFQIDDEAVARQQLFERQREHWLDPFDPVSVQPLAESYVVSFRLAMTEVHQPLTLTLTTEFGAKQVFNLSAFDGELKQVAVFDEVEYQAYEWALNTSLPLGYHQLTLEIAGDEELYQQSLIITPERCFQPEAFKQNKQWGVSVQLYGVKSETNWGIGDFADLNKLVTYLAKQGADFVGLNPIHALYPAMPESASPYSPSSRRWLNIIYLNVPQMPGYDSVSANSTIS